jgi:hypothetical protein
MKTIFKKLSVVFLALVVFACETENTVIDDVFDTVENGAILRQLSVDGILDLFDTSSGITVNLEYQDAKGSAISNIQGVDVQLSFVDKNGTDDSVSGISFGSITGWDNNTEFGLPRASFSYTLADALAAAGLSVDQLNAGDQFVLNFTLNSTSGTFGSANANGNVSAVGGYYSSPYRVTSNAVCKLNEGIFEGEYDVELVDGTNSYFGDTSNAMGEIATFTATSNTDRTMSIGYLERFGFGPYDFSVSLVCGEVVINGNQDIGLSCGGAPPFGIAPPAEGQANGIFDFNDDSVFTIAFTDNPKEACGAPASYVVYQFTKR